PGTRASAGLDKAHPHPCGGAGDLAGEPLGAGPGAKTPVVLGLVVALLIAMRAPAVLIFGPGQFRCAARLRTAREPPREIRRLAVTERGEDVAAPYLVAEEMRRRRDDRRIRRLRRHPIHAGKMKTADAAGLMAAAAADVVEPSFEAGERADILQRETAFLQRGDDILFREDGIVALALHQA